jgi:hypothetical protein
MKEEKSSIPPEVRVTHAYDNITGAIVPAAYLQHRIALIEAFRACKNVTELWIGNKRLEPERVHRYKRSFRWNMNGPPPEADDDEQDADESEGGDDSTSANGDASEDGEESAGDDEHSESSSGVEGDDEDHGEEDSDAEDRDESAGHAEEHNNDPDEGTEHHDERVQDRRDILFDITSSYNYAVHLAAEAGMRPIRIIPFHQESETAYARTQVGLTDCAGFVKSKAILKRVTALGLSFVNKQRGPQGDPFEQKYESSEIEASERPELTFWQWPAPR